MQTMFLKNATSLVNFYALNKEIAYQYNKVATRKVQNLTPNQALVIWVQHDTKINSKEHRLFYKTKKYMKRITNV